MSRKRPPDPGSDEKRRRTERIAAAEYGVGYGKPPKETQFAPGNRANPNGRKKGKPNHRTIVKRVLEKPIQVKENGRVRKVSQMEAALQVLAHKALKGDARAMGQLLAEGYRAGILNEPQSNQQAGITPDDEAILTSFLRRTGSMSVEGAPGASAPPECDPENPGPDDT